MLDVTDQLRHLGDAVERLLLEESDSSDQVDRSAEPGLRYRRIPRVSLVVAAALAVLAATAALLVARSDPDVTGVATDDSSAEGVFSSPAGVVLLFSDGLDGVTAVDLDRRVAGRRALDGERAGDQPYRLALTSDHLVVGWGEIYASPLTGNASTKIDDATIYVPAAEPGEVWTVTWQGGRIGQGPSSLRRVDLDGTVTYSTDGFDAERFSPLIGVPGGLAVDTTAGVAVWDASTGTIGRILGPGSVRAVSSNGHRLAWCTGTCGTTHVVPLERTGEATAPHLAASSHAIALSPDDRYLAVLQPGGGPQPNLVVTDLATGTETILEATGFDELSSLNWTADSTQLYVTGYAYGRPATTIGRYVPAIRTWELETIPVGGGLGAITLDPGQAQSFFSRDLVDPAQCAPPTVAPSDRASVCTFAF